MEGESELWSAAAAFRGTEEYAAAFDLEVWRAQQQARLRAELSEEKLKLQKSLAAEVRRKEEQRLEELNSFRKDLEQLARRLQLREEALEKHIAQFEAREAVFEARRVKVAEQHEQHLVALEARTRRQVEEARVQQDILKAQLSERDNTITRLEEKLRAMESEYDTLQRCLSRTITDDDDKKRVTLLEEELSKANTALMKLQVQLKERDSDLAMVRKERDQLERASKLYKDQLNQLAQSYSKLQEQWHNRERTLLEDDRRKLEEAKRQHQLALRQKGNEVKGTHRYELLGYQVSENITPYSGKNLFSISSDNNDYTGGKGSENDSQTLLKELKSEVTKGLRDLKTKGKKNTTKSRQNIVYAEVTPIQEKETFLKSIKNDAEMKETESSHIHHRHLHKPVQRISSHDDAINSTLSSLSHRESEDHHESTEPYSSPLEEKPPIQEEIEKKDFDISSSYCYAEVESWTTDVEEQNVTSKDMMTGSYLPPLAPVIDTKFQPPPPPPLPLPEDFVQASRAVPPPASRESTRAEMIAFVEKLRANKQKLLESGVYDANDILLKEMTDKIALYEDFLSRHF